MILLPDHLSEKFHLTSLRAERLANVLPELRGRVLDIGAGDNTLLKLHSSKEDNIGVDVVDWGGGCMILPDCKKLPFPDESFDTVSFVACLNHIPEREQTLREAFRVLRPGGRVVITMIGNLIGTVGHAIWWYSEDKHREVHPEEKMGMNPAAVRELLAKSGFSFIQETGFVYGMNSLFIAFK